MRTSGQFDVKYLAVIQARLFSSRFPNKVMQLINGKTMLRHVWDAAKGSWAGEVVVAWPERWPEMDENDMYGKFCLLVKEFNPKYLIRLTADCPLITSQVINDAITAFQMGVRRYPAVEYFNNRRDGFDVQIFTPDYMYEHPHKENVINDLPNIGGLSVNTPEDLETVRRYAK